MRKLRTVMSLLLGAVHFGQTSVMYRELRICVPESLVGDVMGDLNKRRGSVLGMNPHERKSGYTVIEASVPKAEMMDYVISLRAMSQGRGSFEFAVDRYEEVPANVAQKIIAESHVEEDE